MHGPPKETSTATFFPSSFEYDLKAALKKLGVFDYEMHSIPNNDAYPTFKAHKLKNGGIYEGQWFKNKNTEEASIIMEIFTKETGLTVNSTE